MIDFILLQLFIPYVLFIIVGIILFLFVNKVFKTIKKFKFVQQFTLYQKILEHYMEKAYGIIHKDRLLVWSLEATRISDDEFSKISKEYAELVIKLLGPMLYEELIFLHGGDSTLLFTMIEYFNDKYENDEIRSAAVENLQIKDNE